MNESTDFSGLYRRFETFGKELQQANQRFKSLRDLFANGRAHNFEPTNPTDPLNRAVRRCKYVYQIFVAGVFSAGKSTLINALLDAKDLLPQADLPYTGVVTTIKYGSRYGFSVTWLDVDGCYRRVNQILERKLGGCTFDPLTPANVRQGLRITAGTPSGGAKRGAEETVDEFRQFIENYDVIRTSPVAFERRKMFLVGGGYVGNRYYSAAEKKEYLDAAGDGVDSLRFFDKTVVAMIDTATVEMPHENLAQQVQILDTPGLGSVNEIHEERTRALLKDTDCVLVVNKEVGARDAADIVSSKYRESMEGLYETKQQLDASSRLNAGNTKERVGDQIFFIWNKFDDAKRQDLNQSWPAFIAMIPAKNPQIRLTCSGAYFYEDIAKTLRDKYKSGGDSRYPELNHAVAQLLSDDDKGGIKSFRGDILEHCKSRAHYLKLEEILETFQRNFVSLKNAIADELNTATTKYPNAEDLRRDYVTRAFEALVGRLIGTGDRPGSIEKFKSGYLLGTSNSPFADDVGNAFFHDEVTDLLNQFREELRDEVERKFEDLLQNQPVPDVNRNRFLPADAMIAYAKLVPWYHEKVVAVAQSVIGKAVGDKFDQITDRAGFATKVKKLLPLDESRVRNVERIFDRFRELVDHSLSGRIAETLESAPSVEVLQRGVTNVPENRQDFYSRLRKNFEAHFEPHLNDRVVPKLKDVLRTYVANDVGLVQREFKTGLKSLRDHVASANNARLIDLKDGELDLLPDPEFLKYLKISPFCEEVNRLQVECKELGVQFGRLPAPAPREMVDWLRTAAPGVHRVKRAEERAGEASV
jgi:hypothetical protein